MAKQNNPVNGTVSDGRETVELEFRGEGGGTVKRTLDLEGLTGLIQTLGELRARMVEGEKPPELHGKQIISIINPAWFTNYYKDQKASGIAFYHPYYGAVGFMIPIPQVTYLLSLLATQVADASGQLPLPPEGGKEKPN